MPKLILASASPRRRDLLEQIHVIPDMILPADIDETPLVGELPRQYALRIARAKGDAIHSKKDVQNADHFIFSADTVVACGRRILPKTEDEKTARECLTLLSGRRHRVYGGISLITPEGKCHNHCIQTVVQFKRLDRTDIDAYINTGEWHGKAGGYAIQGFAAAFISFVQGSYSNVVGLDLFKTAQLLKPYQMLKYYGAD